MDSTSAAEWRAKSDVRLHTEAESARWLKQKLGHLFIAKPHEAHQGPQSRVEKFRQPL